MQETKVTFETAKLAKEKGFNWASKCYHSDGSFQDRQRLDNYNDSMFTDGNEYLISAPTQSLLQKWLREVHNSHVSIVEGFQDGKIYYEAWVNIFKNKKFEEQHFDLEMYSDKYEEALEKALQEALKLIKQ
jgi:hypothetical protein